MAKVPFVVNAPHGVDASTQADGVAHFAYYDCEQADFAGETGISVTYSFGSYAEVSIGGYGEPTRYWFLVPDNFEGKHTSLQAFEDFARSIVSVFTLWENAMQGLQ